MGATIAPAPKRHQNYLVSTLAAVALKADLAPRHYRIAPPGDMPRKAPSAASGRRPVVTGRCASDHSPDEHHHGAEHRLVGAGHLHVGPAGVRCAQDAPTALDGHQPHPRRAAGTVRSHRHMRPWAAGSSESTYAKSPVAESGSSASSTRSTNVSGPNIAPGRCRSTQASGSLPARRGAQSHLVVDQHRRRPAPRRIDAEAKTALARAAARPEERVQAVARFPRPAAASRT